MPADGFVAGNRLLAALPPDVLEHLAPELETVPIRNREVLQRVGRQAEHVYFPHSGMGSIVIQMQGGVNVEAATVGNEGILGISYVLGDTLATEETVIQLPGEASRLRIRVLRAEFDRDERLRMLLLRYSQLLMGQIAQGSACNRLHQIEGRCARWLLSTHDRVAGDTLSFNAGFPGTDARRSASRRFGRAARVAAGRANRLHPGPSHNSGSRRSGRGCLRVLPRCSRPIRPVLHLRPSWPRRTRKPPDLIEPGIRTDFRFVRRERARSSAPGWAGYGRISPIPRARVSGSCRWRSAGIRSVR